MSHRSIKWTNNDNVVYEANLKLSDILLYLTLSGNDYLNCQTV
jgi:hypothetical protein